MKTEQDRLTPSDPAYIRMRHMSTLEVVRYLIFQKIILDGGEEGIFSFHFQ
jgi:hypothetical protein